MKENQSQKVKNNENKGRGLFYGVIAVATLIIMGVGTTFAYFTATTNSADTSVQTGSTTLKLQYISYEGAWMNRDLIPADTNVVEYSFEYQDDTTIDVDATDYTTKRQNTLCKDDFGNSICSVYVFQVFNSANSPQSVSLDVISQTNGFKNLHAMGYEVAVSSVTDSDEYKNYFPDLGDTVGFLNVLNGTGDPQFKETELEEGDSFAVRDGDGNFMEPDSYTPIYVNRLGVTKTLLKYKKSESEILPSIDRKLVWVDDSDEAPVVEAKERTIRVADNIEIGGNSTKTFALVLYIKNENYDQTTEDALKTFSGKVIVSSGGGEVGVSGTINVDAKKQLQSGNSLGTDPEIGE